MKKQLLIELLAALAKRVNREQDEENIPSGLAEEVSKVLKPVKPAVSFRKDLRSRLEMIAQKRVIVEPRRRRSWVLFLVAAAVGSALSTLGFLAYFISSRLGRRSQTAS
jgi:hypothetical protein